MYKLFFLLTITLQLATTICCGQVSTSPINPKYFINAKEFSKEISLYKSKKFVIEQVFGNSNEVIKFEIDPLAAASSGELTSLVYQCASKQKEGMLLGFYGSYWNDAGTSYQGFAFKDLPKEKALHLLNIIEKRISENKKYLYDDGDNNNIYFDVDDITFLIYAGSNEVRMRVFWNGFDAEWDITAFRRTKRRFEKKID